MIKSPFSYSIKFEFNAYQIESLMAESATFRSIVSHKLVTKELLDLVAPKEDRVASENSAIEKLIQYLNDCFTPTRFIGLGGKMDAINYIRKVWVKNHESELTPETLKDLSTLVGAKNFVEANLVDSPEYSTAEKK